MQQQTVLAVVALVVAVDTRVDKEQQRKETTEERGKCTLMQTGFISFLSCRSGRSSVNSRMVVKRVIHAHSRQSQYCYLTYI